MRQILHPYTSPPIHPRRTTIRWAVGLAILFLVAASLLSGPLQAQVPEDTVAVEQETPTETENLLGFAPPEPGVVVGDSLPALRPEYEPARMLNDLSGSFLYDLGGYGWPHGWSPYGLTPHRVALRLDGHTFDDLITGRPRYDLLPPAFLEPMRVEQARYGAPAMVHAKTRDFVALQPLTELRYFTGDDGLQSILAMHTQERDVALFGEDEEGVIAFLFGYGGHAADNEYPGSRLSAQRQTVFRLRYEQVRWSLELRNFHNRHRIGAHAGVNEPVYEREFASVDNPDAERQTIRNDLSATLRLHLVPGLELPLTASATWTAQSLRYTEPDEELPIRAHRVGVRVHQGLRLGAHRLQLVGEYWGERANWSPAMPRRARQELYAALRDSVQVAGFQTVFEGGVQHTYRTVPVGLLRLERAIGPLRWLGEVAHAAPHISRVEAYGFEGVLASVTRPPRGRVMQGQSALSLRAGAFDVSISAALRRETDMVDLFTIPEPDTAPIDGEQPASPTAVAWILPSPLDHATATLDVGFRREARRGLYATVQPTLFRVLNPEASVLHERFDQGLPELYLQGRLGARFVAFQDLDTDLSVRTRAWTAFVSRTLHPETGLLALPEVNVAPFGPSNTVDVVLEAALFDARIFLSWENVFSGIAFPGNLITPIYPLPERRLRFGVWWPITG